MSRFADTSDEPMDRVEIRGRFARLLFGLATARDLVPAMSPFKQPGQIGLSLRDTWRYERNLRGLLYALFLVLGFVGSLYQSYWGLVDFPTHVVSVLVTFGAWLVAYGSFWVPTGRSMLAYEVVDVIRSVAAGVVWGGGLATVGLLVGFERAVLLVGITIVFLLVDLFLSVAKAAIRR